MPQLKCPACGARGETRGTEEHFEVRGQWPVGNLPVRKCRRCGVGLVVKVRLAPPGLKAERIDDATWAEMEASWYRSFGHPQSREPQGQTFDAWAANPDLSGTTTVQEQFDRFLAEADNAPSVSDVDDSSNQANAKDVSPHHSNGVGVSNLDLFKAFLEEDDWPYTQLEHHSALMSGFTGENGSWGIFIWTSDNGVVTVDSELEESVPADRRNDVANLLTRLNYGLTVGGFQFDFSDGDLKFHTGISVKGAHLQDSMISSLLYANVATMDMFFKVIMSVIYEGVDAVSAAESVQ